MMLIRALSRSLYFKFLRSSKMLCPRSSPSLCRHVEMSIMRSSWCLEPNRPLEHPIAWHHPSLQNGGSNWTSCSGLIMRLRASSVEL
uniref:Uncharacterized protein n=1 Tax=Picea glauca TaxID=3330 RepID=A0A124GNP9_PICGL|nr:hypothetical protein ABT39_MTgene2731 [Picea glauca]